MTEHVVSISLSSDREALAADTASRAHVVVEIRATGERLEHTRPPLSAVLAVDVSASMQGPPIEQVIHSIDKLADLFEERDRVGVVAFSHGATVVCAAAAMTSEGKRALRQRTRRLEVDGGTNIEAGLRLAASLLGRRSVDERRIVLLLSDGAPNVGASSAAELAALVQPMRPGNSVSSLGYGVSHNEDVLTAISDAGGGPYHFIADPDMCQLELAKAVGAAGDMIADGLDLSLVPAPGVEVVRVLGGPQCRFTASGLTMQLPDMLDGASRLVVLEIAALPTAERLATDVLSAKLSYRRAGSSRPLSRDATLSLNVKRVASKSGALVPATNAMVLLARSDEVRSEARALADRGQFDGAAALLRGIIAQIEAAPGYVAADGSRLSEACELLIDEAMAMERRPSREQYQSFRKQARSASLAGDAVVVPKQGEYAKALSAATAGRFPEAYLVVLCGPSMGTRHRLGEECTIGRTTSAHLQVASSSVSRRHVSVYALEGNFWAADLGSTNPTFVNDQPLRSKPHMLTQGDVIHVGDAKLRYDEVK